MEERSTMIAGIGVSYKSCTPWPQGLDPAIYDEEGNIYVSHRFVEMDPDAAGLVVFHEQTEIDQKAAGRSHAYAHRRALLLQLLAAKTIFVEPERLRQFVHSHIGGYPDWTLPNKAEVAEWLYDLLSAERPLRGRLLDVIKEARL
jgi:hypothetical protein